MTFFEIKVKKFAIYFRKRWPFFYQKPRKLRSGCLKKRPSTLTFDRFFFCQVETRISWREVESSEDSFEYWKLFLRNVVTTENRWKFTWLLLDALSKAKRADLVSVRMETYHGGYEAKCSILLEWQRKRAMKICKMLCLWGEKPGSLFLRSFVHYRIVSIL